MAAESNNQSRRASDDMHSKGKRSTKFNIHVSALPVVVIYLKTRSTSYTEAR